MKSCTQKRKHTLFHSCRLAAQIACFAITVFGSFALIKSLGLPNWAFIGTVILAGLFFCGWACPFGTTQEWLRALGKRVTGVTLNIPEKINRYLLLSRYLLPVLGTVLVLAALDARRTFIMSLAGSAAETAAYAVLGVILILSLFVDRPYCKYLCGFGAVFGLMSVLRFFGVKRDDHACVQCGKCSSACQMGVEVAKAHTVRDPNCINCGKCVSACPVPGALAVGFAPPSRKDLAALRRKYFAESASAAERDQSTPSRDDKDAA